MDLLYHGQDKEYPAKSQAEESQDVAIPGIDCLLFGWRNPASHMGNGHHPRTTQDTPVGIDDSGDPSGGRSKEVTSVFDSSDHSHRKVLVRCRAHPVPAIVGNGHQELSPLFGKPADQIWKYYFVADGRTERIILISMECVLLARGNLPYSMGHALDEGKDLFVRRVLTEGDEMYLEVLGYRQVRPKAERRVEIQNSFSLDGDFVRPDEESASSLLNETKEPLFKFLVEILWTAETKSDRELGPDDELSTITIGLITELQVPIE